MPFFNFGIFGNVTTALSIPLYTPVAGSGLAGQGQLARLFPVACRAFRVLAGAFKTWFRVHYHVLQSSQILQKSMKKGYLYPLIFSKSSLYNMHKDSENHVFKPFSLLWHISNTPKTPSKQGFNYSQNICLTNSCVSLQYLVLPCSSICTIKG
jgi:hypothetical protein